GTAGDSSFRAEAGEPLACSVGRTFLSALACPICGNLGKDGRTGMYTPPNQRSVSKKGCAFGCAKGCAFVAQRLRPGLRFCCAKVAPRVALLLRKGCAARGGVRVARATKRNKMLIVRSGSKKLIPQGTEPSVSASKAQSNALELHGRPCCSQFLKN